MHTLGGGLVVEARQRRGEVLALTFSFSVYLQCGQVCLLGEQGFLLLGGIRVVSVFIQPVPQDLHRLLGQVASPPSLARGR